MTFMGSGSMQSANLHDMPCDLRVVDVSKHFDGFSLQHVSLGVPRGYVVGLIGQNGAGKTTLMRAALGIMDIDGGRIELFGSDVASLSERDLMAAKRRIAFVSDVLGFPGSLTTSDVRRMYELSYPAFDGEAFEGFCRRMELVDKGGRVRDLSRGMGMKLQLACALATGAEVLVMDEPTAGLDPVVREEVLDVIRGWMEEGERSALISSHITSDLERIADYVVMIDDGRVLLSFGRDELEQIGVAHLRSSQLEQVLGDGLIQQGTSHMLRRDLECALLVPDRPAFLSTYPDFVCDRASIDDVMTLVVKGEVI